MSKPISRYEKRVRELEALDMCRSDAQAVADLEFMCAAAPELLAALKWLARFCCLGDHDRNDPAIARVWAAIAKAEGRSE